MQNRSCADLRTTMYDKYTFIFWVNKDENDSGVIFVILLFYINIRSDGSVWTKRCSEEARKNRKKDEDKE